MLLAASGKENVEEKKDGKSSGGFHRVASE
jgi:hypothetical protein